MAAILLSLVLFLAPQVNTANQPPATSPAGGCTLSGTVQSASTGEPLRRAVITLYKFGKGAGKFTAETDASGQFKIKNLAPGRYFVSASHPGYVSVQYSPHGQATHIVFLIISSGETSRNLSFRLPLEGIISGHVYNEDGKPIEGAQVLALWDSYLQGTPRLMTGGFARTDAGGRYRLGELAPRNYFIRASVGSAAGGSAYADAPAYYPGAATASQAAPVAVRAGSEFSGLNFFLQRVRTFHIRGRVTSTANNVPFKNIRLTLVSRTPLREKDGSHVKDAQGDFDIPGVIPGSYYLVASLIDQGTLYSSRQPIAITDTSVDGISLVLMPGATLAGTVRAAGPVNLSSMRVFLEPRHNAAIRWQRNSAAVRQDGTFQFDGIPDGGYFIRVAGLPPNAYVKSATLSGQNVLDSGFEVLSGQAPGSTLKLVVSANGGRLGGSVMLGGKPFGGASVTLLPADSSRLSSDWWVKSTTTNPDGNFMLAGIRPGDYHLFAWQKIQPGEERDPAFLAQFQDQGKDVQIEPGAMLTLQVNAIPSSQIQAAEVP